VNPAASLVTVASSSSTSNVSTFFTGKTGGANFAILELDQESKDLVYDAAHGVIYLSAPNGNSIAVLEPTIGGISTTQFAGSNPEVLAIADDDSFLYVGIHGAGSVQRFVLPNLTPDIEYGLGRDTFFGPYYALDLQVAPGEPHTAAVATGADGVDPFSQGGIMIFDDSTRRPTIASSNFGYYDSIQWGIDATALCAGDYEVSSFDLYTLNVDASGITLDHDYLNSLSRYLSRIHFERDTKLIYTDDGHVIDPADGSPVGNYSTFGPMVPDSALDNSFFVVGTSSSSSTYTIDAYDLTHFTYIGSITIYNVIGKPLRLIRWGQNGLAFNTDGGRVFLIGGNFVH
jgi:hypothetical protein